MKAPFENCPDCVFPGAAAAVTSFTVPCVASMVAPSAIRRGWLRSAKVRLPATLTRTTPDTRETSTVRPSTGRRLELRATRRWGVACRSGRMPVDALASGAYAAPAPINETVSAMRIERSHGRSDRDLIVCELTCARASVSALLGSRLGGEPGFVSSANSEHRFVGSQGSAPPPVRGGVARILLGEGHGKAIRG